MKVLIIDDEAHIREMMRLTLEVTGHEVGEAADGEEGLAQFGDGSGYDVVLLDQKMPGIDGLETLRRLLRARLIPASSWSPPSRRSSWPSMPCGSARPLPAEADDARSPARRGCGRFDGAAGSTPSRAPQTFRPAGEALHRSCHAEWFQNSGCSSADRCGERRTYLSRQAFCRRDGIDGDGVDRSRGGWPRRATEPSIAQAEWRILAVTGRATLGRVLVE